VLAQPAIRALWIASLISYVGDAFGALALFVLVNSSTHSTLALASLGITQTLPLFLGVGAGVLVDRWRYRPVLLTTDLIRAALVPIYLLFPHTAGLWLVLLVALTVSLAARFFRPASQALRRALLQPAEYAVAASLWQATVGMSYVVGPALAGLTIGLFGSAGVTVALLVDSLSFVLSAAILFFGVRTAAQTIDAARTAQPHPSAWTDLREGWAFMWQSRPIRGVLLLYGVGLLGVGAVFVLVVPYVQRLFGGGALQVGLLDAVQAFGLALGAIGVGTVALRRFAAGDLLLAAAAVGGLAVVALGLAPVYALALLAMLAAGAAAGTVESAGAAVTLHVVPQQHQGKASATLDTLLNAAYVASITLAGLGGDTVGIRWVFVAGGVVAVLGALAAVPLLRGLIPPAQEPLPSPAVDLNPDSLPGGQAGVEEVMPIS
jgi:DHA3 family macrolide efflux protein-like MFS transporter